MALGAKRGDVLRGVAQHSARLVAIGLGAGILGSLALSRLVSGLLFEVLPRDVPTLILATSTLAVITLLASLVPALRATRVDPIAALRAD
jgi:putative ABC transport system permease protein